jgi:ABC-2 type transport system ATP-binding protein
VSAAGIATDSAVEVERLRVVRGGREVIADLSLEMPRGRITGLLGPSGCGKTTLMRAIVGVQIVDSGAVRVLGEPAGSRSLRPRVGYVTQAPSVYGELTVSENLRYFARVLGAPRERIAAVLATVGLGEFTDDVVDRLSGGQRARVSLATALLGEPELLVLDEPTVGLDPVLRDELWTAFRRLADGGATLLISSHVMDEADRCDSLLLMREGRIVAIGSPSELKRRTGAPDVGGAFLQIIRSGQGAAE